MPPRDANPDLGQCGRPRVAAPFAWRRSADRRGFTLLETMLTLALIAAVTALAWPALERPFALERLRKAADQLHAELTRARATAVRTGRTHELTVDATTGRYLVAPTIDFSEVDASIAATDFGAPVQIAADGNSVGPGTALPVGVRIAEIAAVDDVTPAPEPVGYAQAPASDAVQASQTIYFHPDGTSSTATIILVNDYGLGMRLELRGLTGAVAKGEPQVWETTP